MGTYWRVVLFSEDHVSETDLTAQISSLFERVISIFSLWRADSFVSRLNASSPGTAYSCDELFWPVWQTYLDIGARVGPAFSPLFPLKTEHAAPPLPDLQDLTSNAGKIVRPAGFGFDLNAAAKGFAVDLVSELLLRQSLTSFLIDIGGDFRAHGIKPDQAPYWIEIDPRMTSPNILRIAAVNEAVATSGQIEHAILGDNDYSSHIRGVDIDLNTVITVIMPTCMLADGWATALLAAGGQGLELANANQIPAVFCRTGEPAKVSSAAMAYLQD